MKKYNHYHYNTKLLEHARELRSEKPTRGERQLWKTVLCSKQCKTRFLRQRPITNFIVDFFAPEVGLIIEIDGSSHLNKGEYDFYRESCLKELGYTILRFKEGEVFNQLDDVKIRIEYAISCLKQI